MSSHIFTQWGRLILFSPDHFPGQHKNVESPPIYLFLRTFRAGRTYFLSVPFIAAESQHHEESRLIYGPFESTLLDQGFPVEHELDACNPPLTGTLLCRLLLCLQRRVILFRHPATSFLGNLFRRTSCLSPIATRITHLWVKHHSCPLTANTTFTMSIATHFPLRHSALPWQSRRTFRSGI